MREGDVAPGSSKGIVLVGEDTAVLASTPSGAVSCHTWPLQPEPTGVSIIVSESTRNSTTLSVGVTVKVQNFME